MENISYFCIVENIKRIYIILILSAFFNTTVFADSTNTVNESSPIHVSLLTCQPGDEVYSLYGHTAIRYRNTDKDIDIAINYGMFSFNKPYFILRFIFGLTDYEMGIVPFERFVMEYEFTRRGVYEQELNLTTEEKTKLIEAIEKNYLPENRTYRYNYLYDNCTTRARDIITGSITKDRQLKFNKATDMHKTSYRKIIHLYNNDYPWARFGNDLLLGLKADQPISYRQSQFLPDNLKDAFQKATIKNQYNNAETPLVNTSEWVVEPFKNTLDNKFTPRPVHCAWIIFIISAISAIIEKRRKKIIWSIDLALMLLTGCAGVIIFLMVFSQHPTTSLNLQILLLNPLTLIFAIRSVKRTVRKRNDNFWKYAASSIILFLIGGFFQCYAEGMYILAFAMLIRCFSNIYNIERHET